MSKKPPQSSFARTKVIGQVATKVAGKKLATSTKSLFLNEVDKNALRSRSRQEIAQMIFDGLTQLRGTALKLAQLFCGETGLLPQEYMKAFEQSHYRVPPLSTVLVRQVLRRELGADVSVLFSEFDLQAVAAASLGQVHRARLMTGEHIAVKIQYPGISQTVVNDFAMARKLLKPFASTGLIIKVLDELEERLHQEVDYLVEQGNLNWFRAQNLPKQIYLPIVYSEHTRSSVLTMEYVTGVHVDEWLLTGPDQSRRNQVAQTLFDFFLQSVFSFHKLHADPNFGNFLICAEDQVAVVDFGAVKTMSPDEVNFYRLLWSTQPNDDAEALLLVYQKCGAEVNEGGLMANQNIIDQAIKPYLFWIQQLLSQNTFDFKQNPTFVREGHEIFSQQLFNPQLQNFNSGLTLVHRTLLGLMVIFQRLGAEIEVPDF